MDPFTIAALVAMVGGAAMQYKASTDASKRAERETLASLDRQRQFQLMAEKKAAETANEYLPEDRKKEQKQIEEQITAELTAPVTEAQNINNATSTTQGDVSDDYTLAKAASNVNRLKSAETLARLLGRTTSANRLRQNEAIRFADAVGSVNRIGNFARGQYNADQLAIENAAIPDAGLQLAGGLTSSLGGAALMGGASGTIGKLFGQGAGQTEQAAAQFAKNAWPPIKF